MSHAGVGPFLDFRDQNIDLGFENKGFWKVILRFQKVTQTVGFFTFCGGAATPLRYVMNYQGNSSHILTFVSKKIDLPFVLATF